MADELKTWISAQAQAGRTPEEVIATLVQSGWTRPQALGAMQDFLAYSDAPDQPVKLLETVAANDGPDLQPAVPVPEPSLPWS